MKDLPEIGPNLFENRSSGLGEEYSTEMWPEFESGGSGLGEESSTEVDEDDLGYSTCRIRRVVQCAFQRADPTFYARYLPDFISLGELIVEGQKHTHLQYRVESQTLDPEIAESFLQEVVGEVSTVLGKKFALSFVIDRDGT